MHFRNIVLLCLCCAAMILNGCAVAAKVTGGGSLPSANGSDPAAFTVTGDNCGDSVKGKATLVDRFAPGYSSSGGVRLTADVVRAAQCVVESSEKNIGTCSCSPGEYEVDFSYTSTNSKIRGAGEGTACLSNSGKGKGKNHARVTLSSGVYNGYSTEGDVAGNFNLAACDQ